MKTPVIATDNYNGRLQRPLRAGFTATSTAAGVIAGIDLGGHTAVVTGGYAGISFERVKTQGAATTVWCATSPILNDIGGVYCENADIAELDNGNIEHHFDEPLSLRGVKPYSADGENARRLWKLTEEMTGVRFAF